MRSVNAGAIWAKPGMRTPSRPSFLELRVSSTGALLPVRAIRSSVRSAEGSRQMSR